MTDVGGHRCYVPCLHHDLGPLGPGIAVFDVPDDLVGELDEPFGAVDAIVRASLQEEIRRIHRDLGTTIYKISPLGVFAWKSYGLTKDKTLPFLPNTGYAFVVIHPAYSLLKSSWHGREAISVPVEKPRLSILNTYYREPEKADA